MYRTFFWEKNPNMKTWQSSFRKYILKNFLWKKLCEWPSRQERVPLPIIYIETAISYLRLFFEKTKDSQNGQESIT